MPELLNAVVTTEDGHEVGFLTVKEHKTGSTGSCKVAFSGNKVLGMLR